MIKAALIIVDVLNDFADPKGALYVSGGETIIGTINKLMELPFEKIVAIQDWHPSDHGSFASNSGNEIFTAGELNGLQQIWWPDHCIQGSWGAEFHPELNINKADVIFRKGMDPKVDSYSGFFDNGARSTGLSNYLKTFNIRVIYVVGIATDYCIKYTVLDAVKHFERVNIITDACVAVNMSPRDSEKAIDDMVDAGARASYSTMIKNHLESNSVFGFGLY